MGMSVEEGGREKHTRSMAEMGVQRKRQAQKEMT